MNLFHFLKIITSERIVGIILFGNVSISEKINYQAYKKIAKC
jgi:hypothetical protein